MEVHAQKHPSLTQSLFLSFLSQLPILNILLKIFRDPTLTNTAPTLLTSPTPVLFPTYFFTNCYPILLLTYIPIPAPISITIPISILIPTHFSTLVPNPTFLLTLITLPLLIFLFLLLFLVPTPFCNPTSVLPIPTPSPIFFLVLSISTPILPIISKHILPL